MIPLTYYVSILYKTDADRAVALEEAFEAARKAPEDHDVQIIVRKPTDFEKVRALGYGVDVQ